MAFLIIDSDKVFADSLAAGLVKEFGAEVHIKEQVSEAIALMELLDEFQFVISVKSQKDKSLGDKLVSFINSEALTNRPELIFLGVMPSETAKNPVLLLPLTTKVKELIQVLKTKKDYQKKLEQIKQAASIEYASIPLRLFYYVSSAPDDLFLKIKKEGKPHLVKRFNQKAALEEADLNSLKEKGVKFLYVEKEKLRFFFEVFDKRLAELAQVAPDQFISESDLENYAFHSLSKFGVSESSLKVAQSASQEAAKKLSNDKKFQTALKEIIKGKSLGLRQLNSKMVSLISHFIIKGSELDTAQIRTNMIMASFLQDSKLTDEYAGIRSVAELQALLLEDKDNVLIDKHAALAADQLEKFSHIPSEVIKIVRHHHGSVEGKGFSRELKAISSLQSLVFLLAEEVSFAIIKRERSSINLGEILEGISHKYQYNEKLDKLIEQFEKNLKSS